MGLVLKHVQTTKAGTLHYRRKVPNAARAALGKSEFKRLLGVTQREALLAYPKINAEFERLVAAALRPPTPAPDQNRQPTPLDHWREAQARLAAFGPDMPQEHREITADEVLDRYPRDPDTGHPVDLHAVDGFFVSGLLGASARPEPTLEDAKRLYLQERVEGEINEDARRSRVDRVTRHLDATLGLDRALSKLERNDAREVRDYLLKDLDMKPATARRYLVDIRAIVSLGIKEFGLRAVENPFLGLPVKADGLARDGRKPFAQSQIVAMRRRLSSSASASLNQIWRMLEGTGCRLAEVTGLMVSDVVLDAPHPYIDLVVHQHRRLKNTGSIRRVPLVGDALKAASEAMKTAGEGPLLFSGYGHKRGPDAASAALMRHVRTVTVDPKITVHSLRHRMEDLLSLAGVDEFDRNLVLGHAKGTMSERYGGPDARLEVASRVLSRALNVPTKLPRKPIKRG